MSTNNLEAIIAGLATDLKPVVAEIENNKFPTTQNNYGKYLDILSTLGEGDTDMTQIIAIALIDAGGNKSGIASALGILGIKV